MRLIDAGRSRWQSNIDKVGYGWAPSRFPPKRLIDAGRSRWPSNIGKVGDKKRSEANQARRRQLPSPAIFSAKISKP
jgi:hypothetical protein